MDTRIDGQALHDCVADLYPLCRSITGEGMRETLRRLDRIVPLTIHEVSSGTPVLDWTVPPEWNIREAWIEDPRGRRVVDFRRSSLHVVGYSTPVDRRMSLAELRPHLHTLPDRPRWIPYRTSYYREDWGFCLSQDALDALPEGEYRVFIDSSLAPGSLTYGEAYLPGAMPDEILVSCHVCHPALANDNLSGVVVAAHLARLLATRARRHSFRFLFIPGTIGSITWLARNEAVLPRIRHGLVLTCLGDAGMFTYKKSRRGDAPVDRAAALVLAERGAHAVDDFTPYGYDERQYCSPGYDLPVGCLARTPHGRFAEYHTSADNLDFVAPRNLAESLATCLRLVEVLERDRTWVNLCPKGEPQLGRRGLYRAIGGATDAASLEMALLWVLNLSDGRHSLVDIALRSGVGFDALADAADLLRTHGLLEEAA